MDSLYLALEVDWALLLLASATNEFISEAQLEVHRFPVSTNTFALSCHWVSLK